MSNSLDLSVTVGTEPASIQADLGFGANLNDSYELKSNKVTALSGSSTDTQYPSAKAVYTELTSGLAKKADKSSLGTAAYTNKNDYAKSGELVSEHEYDKRFTIFCDNTDGCYNTESGIPAIYWGVALGENIGRIGDEAERTRICFYNQDESEIHLFLPEISDETQVSYFYANTQHFLLHTDTDLTITLMSAAGIIPVRTIDSANTPVLSLSPGETLEIKAHLVGGSRVTIGLTGRDVGSIFITEGINDEHIEYYNATPYYFVTYTIYPAA